MFEKKVLRRIFGTGRDEVTWEWRKVHNDVLKNFHCVQNIIRVIKSRRLRWAGM
jgi:N-acetyl-beta-hexosaminidase